METYNSKSTLNSQGWEIAGLFDLCDIKTGKKDANFATEDGDFDFFTCAAIPLKCPSFSFSGESLILPGNGANVGLVTYYHGNFEAYQRTYVINSIRINARFLYHYFQSHWEKSLRGKQFGSATNYIRMGNFERFSVPLPPLNEQRRIVEKIEALSAHSRNAREALDAIPALLDQFRQSVLAAAFRGDLTADWRAQHPDVEPASALLERIRTERRQRWEAAELEKMRSKGKEPKNDKWKAKYKHAEPIDWQLFPELPETWELVVVEELVSDLPRSLQSGPFGSNLKHDEFQTEGILSIGIDNVLEGAFSMGRENRISLEKYKELEKYTARPLDVLITVMATVGRCCVIPEGLETAIITKHVYRASPDQALINSYFFMNALRGSRIVLNQIKTSIRGQTRPGINGQILKKLVIPVPPKDEQEKILELINKRMKSINDLEEEVESLSASNNELDQSILAKAFRGQLVPQDPTDEPASHLLARIRSERQTTAAAAKAAKKTKRTPKRTPRTPTA